MADCIVDDVLADNGNASQLWQDLQRVAIDQREALKLYLRAKNAPVPADERDENGEPRIEYLLDRDDLGLTERHRMTWGNGNFSLSRKNAEIIDAFLTQLGKARKSLLNRLSSKIPLSEKKQLQNQLDRLENQMQTLRENKNAATLESVAQDQLEQARSLLEQEDLSSGQLLMAIQMMESWHFDVTKNALGESQLEDENNPYRQTLQEASGDAQALQEQFVKRAWNQALETIQKKSKRDSVSMEDLQSLPEDDFVQSLLRQFFDISRIDHPVIQRIYKLMNGAKKKQSGLIRQKVSELNEKAEGIEDYEPLFQKDEDGEYTGSLVHPYSPDFFKKRKRAFDILRNATVNTEGKTRAQVQAQRDTAISALRKIQEVVDLRYLVEELESPDNTSREEYIAQLKELMAEDEVEAAVEEALNMWAEYQRRKRAMNDLIDSEFEDGTANKREGESNAEYRRRRMEKFEARYSPVRFIQEFKDGKEIAPHNQGHKFVYHTARPEYRSEQWDSLSQDQQKFATYLSNLYADLFQFLPDHMTEGLQENFLPEVRKDVVEQLLENGFFAALKNMDQKMFEQMTGEELNTLFEEEGDTLPEVFQGIGDDSRVPTRFLGRGEDLDMEERSKDLVRVTEMFISMAANYHYMTSVSPEVQLLGRLVQEAAQDAEGGSMFNMTVLENVEHTIDALLYGNYREDEGSEDSFVTDSWMHPVKNFKNKREAQELERKADELEQQFEEGEIDEDTYVEKRNEIENEYAELRGKSSSFFQMIESSIGRFTTFKALALNPRSGIANGLFGLLSASVHASSYQEFTPKELRSAWGTMLNLKRRRSAKVGNLMKNMNILYEIAEIQYGTDKKTQSKRHKWVNRVRKTPYWLMTSTESFIQGLTMVAHMMNTKIENVETVDGETVTISAWEAFGENGEWDTSKYKPKEGWETVVGPQEDSQFFEMADRVTQLNKRLHGNYDVLSPMGIKSTALGRLLMMFKSWVPEGFAYRFESETFDEQLGRTVKGSYRSVWDTGMEHGMAGIKELVEAGVWKDFQNENGNLDLKEVDIKNVRKVLAEMKAYTGLFILMLTLQGMIDDDDQDEAHEYAARYTLNLLFRVRQDITFYLDPATATNIVNNPMPVMRTFTDFSRAADSSMKALQDSDYRGQPLSNWAKNIPIVRQIPKTQWLTNNVFLGE